MQMQTYIKPDFDLFSKREAFFNCLHKSYDNAAEVITTRSIENVPEIDVLDDIYEIEKTVPIRTEHILSYEKSETIPS